jgi:hypothetical protein
VPPTRLCWGRAQPGRRPRWAAPREPPGAGADGLVGGRLLAGCGLLPATAQAEEHALLLPLLPSLWWCSLSWPRAWWAWLDTRGPAGVGGHVATCPGEASLPVPCAPSPLLPCLQAQAPPPRKPARFGAQLQRPLSYLPPHRRAAQPHARWCRAKPSAEPASHCVAPRPLHGTAVPVTGWPSTPRMTASSPLAGIELSLPYCCVQVLAVVLPSNGAWLCAPSPWQGCRGLPSPWVRVPRFLSPGPTVFRCQQVPRLFPTSSSRIQLPPVAREPHRPALGQCLARACSGCHAAGAVRDWWPGHGQGLSPHFQSCKSLFFRVEVV